ncbi:ABC transporter ATP-binding protein [Hazenella sp. IB182353]|uniref:ABC transporter ATP-binding protein n=1 Tax=Polycladospora coralii TaxID=2771432 RepID=UPI001747B9B2|nr:ABC transporter ATP-binding protein [Polycladospora coralii]MBS7531500.1 ABC transporter ATP-binding protein [Polycladospora coralii]
MIRIRQLTKRYGPHTVVNGISFDVQEQEIFGMLGPNGAGKTTTMEMIEGLRKPDEGSIDLFGVDGVRQPQSVKAMIGVQLQSTALFDHLTVKESIELYASFYPQARKTSELLQAFHLQEKENDRVKHLSGGQRQRLAIALAVVHDPKVIFLDEPTTGLDPKARRDLWDVVFQLRDEGRTIILSTHYMEEAEILCDRVAIMNKGEMIDVRKPAEWIRNLSSQNRITFLLSDKTYLPELQRISGVTDVKLDQDDTVTLHTNELSETLSDLILWAKEKHLPLNGLGTRTATLEDVFLAHTGERLSEV